MKIWVKSFIRPIYGTLAFQPFALFWCWLMDVDYWTFMGPFTVYSMFAFIPIYHYYDHLVGYAPTFNRRIDIVAMIKSLHGLHFLSLW